ncbi:MAG TPA: PAS domain S-box protein [Steroidobacteraceae bacterium]|nr:PAS domain S-box protein [Steroidobacteraceae bacterium]
MRVIETTHSVAALADAELHSAHLAAVVESSLDAIVSVSLEGRISSWNAGATSLFGYDAEEMLGRSILQIVPHELHAEELRLLLRIRAGERVAHFDTTRKAKDGRMVSVSLALSPIRDVRGVVVGASKIARDISERRLAEKLVAAEVEALGRLSDLSSSLWRSRGLEQGLNEILVAVIELLNADKGNVQLLESESLRIVVHRGFQAEFLDFFHEVDAGHNCACGRALCLGERIIIEDVELDRDYEAFRPLARAAGYRAVVSTPLIGANGARLGVVSTHFSAVHRPTDQELRRLDLYLRQASDFIQRCQMEEDLRYSREALLEADHRKDEFLALLAHELRNPLAPIRYALASVKNAALTPAQRTHAEQVIERQVANMSRLLDDLLNVSRVSMGKLALKRQHTELKAVLDAAVEAAHPSLEAKGHSLSIKLPPQPVWLVADPMRLAQVFSNLLINAAKYTDAGGRIAISADLDGETVSVSVRDNGIGIAHEMLPHLFAPFFQGDAVPGRAEGGLGIGLSLARGLVRLHGGNIEAFSAGANQGSEFVVQLPIERPRSPQAASEPLVHETPLASARRVLLVDDNRDSADTCGLLLELAGHEVRMAYSGRSALEVAEGFRPHVAVLDIGMPDLDGYELARLIRQSGWGKATVLVAVTGWGRDDDRKRAIAAGFDLHLTKPVTGETLQFLIRSLSESTIDSKPSHPA